MPVITKAFSLSFEIDDTVCLFQNLLYMPWVLYPHSVHQLSD